VGGKVPREAVGIRKQNLLTDKQYRAARRDPRDSSRGMQQDDVHV